MQRFAVVFILLTVICAFVLDKVTDSNSDRQSARLYDYLVSSTVQVRAYKTSRELGMAEGYAA